MNSTQEQLKTQNMKKLNKFAAAIIMVVLAVAANTATAQSLSDFLSTTTVSDSVKTVYTVVDTTHQSSTVEETNPVIFDGQFYGYASASAVVTDDGVGGEARFGLAKNRWAYFVFGRYVQDRSGLGVGIRRDLVGKSENRFFLSGEVMAGALQQNVGIRSDITVEQLEGGLYHGYITKKLRPQLEAGLNLQIRLGNKTFLNLFGGGIWRCCDGDKLSLNSEINFPNAEVVRSSMNSFKKEFGFKCGLGIEFRIF